MASLLRLFASTARDLQDTILPNPLAQKEYRFAFLVHPRDARDIAKKFPFLAKSPLWLQRLIEHHFWPVTVSKITGLTSLVDKTPVEGFVVSIPMTASEMMANKDVALRHIRRATKFARNKGAKIIGLGALTSSLSRGGLDLVDIQGISVTTGHAYTGHTVTSALLNQLREARIDFNSAACVVGIVGAAGSIGSISAELLAAAGVRKLVLIDIDRKMPAVEELRHRLRGEYSHLEIQCTQDMSTLRNTIGVITATNTPDALVRSEHITDGTIIVDDAQPTDIAPELLDRDAVLVLEAGAVHTPNISSNFDMGLAGKHDNFCCLAEVLILAAHHHTHNFVINRATIADVQHIQKGGDELGFTIASPQNEKGLIPKEKIAFVHQHVQARCVS